MKKIIFSLGTLLAFGYASAQEDPSPPPGFSKGDMILSGMISGGTQKQGSLSKTNIFGAGAALGYFIDNHIALGVSADYSHSNGKDTYNQGSLSTESTTESFSGGVFGRYYFTPAGKFSLFAQLDALYSHTDYRYTSIENRAHYQGNGFGMYAGPGLNYFISDHFALQSLIGMFGYGSSKEDEGDTNQKMSGFSARIDLSNVYLGLIYKF